MKRSKSHSRLSGMLALLLSVVMTLTPGMFAVSTPADDDVPDTVVEMTEDDGEAYAVLTEEDELIFLRSEEKHTHNGSVETITDIDGNIYEGRVYLDIETTNSSGVANIRWPGQGSQIKSVRVAPGQTIRPVNMFYWFYNCKNMTSCDLTGFDTSAVTHMDYLFYKCSSLSDLDIGSLDTSSVTGMLDMFGGCNSLSRIVLGPDFSFKGNNITETSKQAKLPGTSKWMRSDGAYGEYSPSELRDNYEPDMAGEWIPAPRGTGGLEVVAVITNNSQVPEGQEFAYAVNIKDNGNNVSGLDILYFGSTAGKLTTDEGGNVSFTLVGGDSVLLSGIPVGYSYEITQQPVDGYTMTVDGTGDEITNGRTGTITDESPTAIFLNTYNPEAGKTSDDPVPEAKTENSGDAYAVLTEEGELVFFRSEEAYENNTVYAAVTDICGNTYAGTVFSGIETLAAAGEIGIPWHDSRENIASVRVAEGQVISPVSTYCWFYDCAGMTACDLSGLDTSSVTDMGRMFYGCSSLADLDISGFDTSQVTGMNSMFYNCRSLTSLDLSHFRTPSVNTMYAMFHTCDGLEFLDISGFDTSSASVVQNMFSYCTSLKKIVLGPDFSFMGDSSASMSPKFAKLPGTSWIRADGAYGPYAPTALSLTYSSEKAGVWREGVSGGITVSNSVKMSSNGGSIKLYNYIGGLGTVGSDVFEYTVTFRDPDGNIVNEDFPVEIMHGGVTVGTDETGLYPTSAAGREVMFYPGEDGMIRSGEKLYLGCNWSARFTLPCGYGYEFEEATHPHYLVKKSVLSGTVSQASPDQEFTYTLSIKDEDGNGVSGITMPYSGSINGNLTTDADGNAEFVLKDAQTVTFTGIPSGYEYSVRQQVVGNYTIDATGTGRYSMWGLKGTTGSGLEEANFTNTFKPLAKTVYADNEVGRFMLKNLITLKDLKIDIMTKNAGRGIGGSDVFEYSVTIYDENGEVTDKSCIFTIYEEHNYTVNADTEFQFPADTGSSVFVYPARQGKIGSGSKFYLKQGWWARLFIPGGYGYSIERSVLPNSTVAVNPITGTAESVPTEGDASQAFRFTMTLKDADGNSVPGFNLRDAEGNVLFVTDDNGQYTTELKGGEAVELYGIPVGYTMSTSEEPVDGYMNTGKGNWENAGFRIGGVTISSWTNRFETPEHTVEFVDESGAVTIQNKNIILNKGTVRVEKAADVPEGKENSDFTYTATALKGSAVTYKKYNADGTQIASGGGSGSGTLIVQGETFTLKGGQYAVFSNLTPGGAYKFTESGTSVSRSGLVPTAVKSGDGSQPFEFDVNIMDASGNIVPDITVTVNGAETGKRTTDANGSITLTLKGGESTTISPLPAGYKVKATETVPDNYINSSKSPSSGKQVVVSDMEKTITFTNRFNPPTVDALFVNAPQVSAENTAEGINVTWDETEGAAYYVVLRKTETATAYTKKAVISADEARSWTDTSVTSGKTYTYKVRCADAKGRYISGNSNEESVFCIRTRKIDASVTYDGIRLSWNTINDVDGYNVCRKETGSAEWAVVATINAGDDLQYTDTTVENGISYEYTVVGYKNINGAYVCGAIDEAKVQTGKYNPAPVITNAYQSGKNICLEWEAVPGAPAYTVLRSVNSGAWTKKAVLTPDNRSWEDTASKTSGKHYVYAIRCSEADGSAYTSARSDEVMVTYLKAPILKLTDLPDGIQADVSIAACTQSVYLFRIEDDGYEVLIDAKGNDGGTSLSFVDNNVDAGENCRYYAVAYCADAAVGSKAKTILHTGEVQGN